MSTNLCLLMEREIILVCNGTKEFQENEIDLMQTPTKVTYKLLELGEVTRYDRGKTNTKEILDGYFRWVRNNHAGIYNDIVTESPRDKDSDDYEEYLRLKIKNMEAKGYRMRFYAL